MAILSAQNLSKKIRGRRIFEGIAFEVERGGLLLLTGPNGSGKTMLLWTLGGVLKPSAGRLHRLMDKSGVAFAPAGRGLDEFLSVRANVHCWAGDAAAAERELSRWGLSPLAKLPAEALSSGQRKRVTLARAFAKRGAGLLLLDEPLQGLDREYRGVLRERLGQALGAGLAAIVADHEPEFYAELKPKILELRPCD